jgi:uncharacterized protein (TIGR02246 family)
MESTILDEIQALYCQLLEEWNNRNAGGMADLFEDKGEIIGYDGSQVIGREEMFSHLSSIFENHPTARFIGKIKRVHLLSSNIAMMRAIAGMVPPGQSELNPKVNTHHTLIVQKNEESWRILLYQNTPALFHGRPELVEQMTEELRHVL